MMNKKILLFGFILLLADCLQAQDPVFSQYYNSRSYLNPAYTGLEHGLTVSAAARNQYSNLSTQFYTALLSAELQEPNLRSGFGIAASRQTIGEAALSLQNLNLSYSYVLPLTNAVKRNAHNISIGLRAGVLQRSLDWSKLRFLDQLDASQGVIGSTNAIPTLDNVVSFDAQAGILWRSEIVLAGLKTQNNLGIAFSHITGTEAGLRGFTTDSPLRTTIHWGTSIPLTSWSYGKHKLAWSPNIRAELQTKLSLMSYGLYLFYDETYIGTFYQSQDITGLPGGINSWILMAGIKVPMSAETDHSLLIGYSYENRLGNIGTLFGSAHEITLRYNFGDAQLIHRQSPTFKGKIIPAKGLF